MYKEIKISEKYNITAKLITPGDDLCVIVTGGDAPHIGAVSAGVFGPGIGAAHITQEEAEKKEPVYTYSYPSHRDGAISEPLAEGLSKKLKKNVAVLCGIHIDNLPKEQILEIVGLIPEMEKMIMCEISSITGDQ